METPERDKLLSRLKPLVNDVNLWKAFTEYLDYLQSINYNKLSNDESVTTLYRTQGHQEAIKHLKNLRDIVGYL